MTTLTPTDALQLFGLIAQLPWTELTANDHMAFNDAGPDARIAQIPANRSGFELSGRLAELLDLRPHFQQPLMAIIGGDALQIEIHGIDAAGDPICWTLPINPFLGL